VESGARAPGIVGYPRGTVTGGLVAGARAAIRPAMYPASWPTQPTSDEATEV
jgi:hypothetical protein